MASNLTEINTNLESLKSQSNVAVNADVKSLEKKFDKLESEQLPALKKDRIEIKSNNISNTVRTSNKETPKENFVIK